MIVFLTLAYVAVLFVLVKMKVLPNTKATWLSTILWSAILFIFLFIPMQWGAPAGKVRIVQRAVQVIPNVNGQVVSIAVKANQPLVKGDLLFQLDPKPFQIALELAEASLARAIAQSQQDKDALNLANAQLQLANAKRLLAQQQYDDDKKLADSGTISQSRLETRQANLDASIASVHQAQASVSRAETEVGAVTKDGVVAKIAEATARLDQAKWNLEQTSVRAPSEGFVTNLALAVGQRVTSLPLAPAMVFIDTSEKALLAEVHQIYLRFVEPGQKVEMAFKTNPGQIINGTVESVLPLASQGQAMVSGVAAQSGGNIQPQPFIVRIALDDPADETHLKAGTVGTSAIYTEKVGTTHVIRKVMIRMESNVNYLKPGL